MTIPATTLLCVYQIVFWLQDLRVIFGRYVNSAQEAEQDR